MCVPAGPVNLSTNAQLVAPAAVLKGTLSVTASELYFEVDEDDPGFKAIDPKVRDSGSIDPACVTAEPRMQGERFNKAGVRGIFKKIKYYYFRCFIL